LNYFKRYNELFFAAGGMSYVFFISLVALNLYKQTRTFEDYKSMVCSFLKLLIILYVPVIWFFSMFFILSGPLYMAYSIPVSMYLLFVLLAYLFTLFWIECFYAKYSETDCKLWIDYISEYIDN